jgi:DNA-binding NarL/FixJ family response regulator
MEFKQEQLVEREIEIAGYLVQRFSLKQISEATGLNKKILAAHIRNMMQKLKSEDMATLKKIIENKGKAEYKS